MVPRIRINGFCNEWKSAPFSQIFDTLKNNSLSRAELNDNGSVKNIHYGDVLIKYGECIDAQNVTTFVGNEDIAKVLYSQNAIQNGDVIFADAAEDNTVGKCAEIIASDEEAIVSGLHTIPCRPKELFASRYLGYYLNSDAYHDQLLPHIQGTKISSISKKALVQTEISFPEFIEEQQAIANYFYSLDKLLQASVEKVESLKQLKSASMISMFPQNGETKPRVRFKGFDDEWKCAKLEDYLVISSEKNSKGIFDKNDVLSVSDDFGVMNQIELLGRSYAGKSVLNYHILQAGEVVYTKSPLKSKPYGIIKMNNGKAGIVSVLYAVYKVKDNALAEYIHYYFDPSWRLNQYMRPLVNKGAKNTMNISDETALTGYILIPNDIEEQRKIASFFTNLDRQIALETQRLEKLKQIKSACLDKMFV